MTHAEPARGWFPLSPCGSGCIPADPAESAARLPWRTARLLVVLAAIAVSAPLLPLVTDRCRSWWWQTAARAVLTAAGVRIVVTGPRRFAVGGVLVVANHVSWIEVLALSAVRPLRMVAKGEIRAWPVIGAAAEAFGAVFVDRARLRDLPAGVARISSALASGDAVGVFPEGTTWCGAAAGPFRRAAFQAAVDTGSPVRPVAVTIRTPDGRPSRAASFVGEETLLACLSRVLRLPGVVCELTVLPMIHPRGTRADVARQAATAIGTVTGVPHGDLVSSPPCACCVAASGRRPRPRTAPAACRWSPVRGGCRR